MTTAQVAQHVGVSRWEAGRWLARHSIKPLGRKPGVGQNLYPAALVRQRHRTVSPQLRRYDFWRDIDGIPITVGARVEQVGIARKHGALTGRVHQRGEVISLGRGSRGTRIQVLFHGELELVGIRPHLVRVPCPARGAAGRRVGRGGVAVQAGRVLAGPVLNIRQREPLDRCASASPRLGRFGLTSTASASNATNSIPNPTHGRRLPGGLPQSAQVASR